MVCCVGVLVVVRCALFVVALLFSVSFVGCCCLGLIVRCVSSFYLGCLLSFALLYFLFGACCPLLVVSCMLLVVCCLLFVFYGFVFDVCCLLRVVVGCQLG